MQACAGQLDDVVLYNHAARALMTKPCRMYLARRLKALLHAMTVQGSTTWLLQLLNFKHMS